LGSFAAYLRIRHVFGTSSGRSALWAILRALRRLRPDRSVVALPAYTCYTVPASIVRSGLKLYPVEIDPATLDLDLAELETVPGEDLLGIISASLFGLVDDFSRIREIARSKGAFVIDDAAQALGAFRGGMPAGTLGDVGFYSFGRGKTLAAIEGGMIVTESDEIAAAIRETGELPPTPRSHEYWLLLELIAYCCFLNPRLYWILRSLPFLKLGTTEFDPDFPVFDLPIVVQGLLPQLLPHLAANNQIRSRNAALLAAALATHPSFTVPRPASDCIPSYLRFPVIAQDREIRAQAVRQLQAEGIGAAPFYPGGICDIPGIEPHMVPRDFHRPKAEDLAQRLMTLPTHSLVERTDFNRMINILTHIKGI
jgi:perosamine synthetase